MTWARGTVLTSKRGWAIAALGSLFVLAGGWWGFSMRHAATARPVSPSPPRPMARADFSIEGMDCMMCAAGLQNKLRSISGVSKAGVSYQDKYAEIVFDPAVVSRERIVSVIEGDGFKVAARDASPQGAAPPPAR